MPTSDLLEMQLGKIRFYTVAAIGARLPKTKVTTEGISGLLAALACADATEGNWFAVKARRNIVTVSWIR
jgi:hypothetical protein